MRNVLSGVGGNASPAFVMDIVIGATGPSAGNGPWFDSSKTSEVFDRVIRSHPEGIADIQKQWKQDLQSCGFELLEFETVDLVFLGQGNVSALQSTVRLHPLFAVPLITGESFKGLVRDCMRRAVFDDGRKAYSADQITTLLGSDPGAALATPGIIAFSDALWVSSRAGAHGFARREVIAPHHQTYHAAEGKNYDVSSLQNSPKPVPTLGATGVFIGGVRCVPRAMPRPIEPLLTSVIEILARACKEGGVGASTRFDHIGRLKVRRVGRTP